MNSAQHRSSKPRGGNAGRQAAVVVALGGVLALGAYGAYRIVAPRSPASASLQSEHEVYSGSILIMPERGSLCHQVSFDNQSGQFADKGYVDCEQAAYRGLDAPKQFSTDRARVISEGFRGR